LLFLWVILRFFVSASLVRRRSVALFGAHPVI
jgi:hypothetical protein